MNSPMIQTLVRYVKQLGDESTRKSVEEEAKKVFIWTIVKRRESKTLSQLHEQHFSSPKPCKQRTCFTLQQNSVLSLKSICCFHFSKTPSSNPTFSFSLACFISYEHHVSWFTKRRQSRSQFHFSQSRWQCESFDGVTNRWIFNVLQVWIKRSKRCWTIWSNSEKICLRESGSHSPILTKSRS